MIYASVCSGVEAASLAWIPLGWKAAWFSEIEPFPCAVLKHRFPEVPNLGDMTKIKVETIENETGKLQRFKNESGADVVVPGGVDLLVGGTPCQSFSFAGNRSGLRGVSGLALTYCKLLETMHPRWFVWENVPGVFSSNGGEDFKMLLKAFDEIGYSVAWRVLDAQYVRVDGYPRAVPQRRRRVFVVGHLGDWRYPASVLFEPGCLPGATPPRRVKGAGVARSLTASTGGASGKEHQYTFISGDGRPLNAIKVIATGQANAETATDICVNLTCNHEAPIVCGCETGQGYWQSGDIAGTLRAEGENRPSRPSSNIICAGFSGGQGAKAGGIGYEDEHAPTIKASFSGGNSVSDVLCVHGSQDPVTQHKLGNTVGRNNGRENCVVYENHPHTFARRLLPIETERLMGFPEVDVLEIGKMTKDEFIAWELASGNITVDFSTGKVFSCRTGGGTPCPPHELEGTILSGYKVVSLREKEVKKQCRVHRILWIAAHGIIPDGYVIDHINNDKLDNRLCNLQLLRPEENSTKAAKDGLYLTGEDHPKTKLTDEQKNDIITLYETEYYSVRRLAAMYGVSKSRIHQLVKRKGWTQIPWRGKSAEDCPDAPRYKACGNSMCVNVMRWIGMRIELTERKIK